MKTLKLALLIAASLLLTSCSSSEIPGEAPAAGGALPSGGMEQTYGKGGGRNNFAVTLPQHTQQDVAVLTE